MEIKEKHIEQGWQREYNELVLTIFFFKCHFSILLTDFSFK